MESFLDSGKVFDLDPEGWICCTFLSSFRKTTWATGSKEDVEKAPGLSPGPATQMAQLRLGQGPSNQPAHGERVCWRIHHLGASWMFRAGDVTGWLFYKNQKNIFFFFHNWVFTAEHIVGFKF